MDDLTPRDVVADQGGSGLMSHDFQDTLFAGFALPNRGEPAFRVVSFSLTADQHELVDEARRAALAVHAAPLGANRNAHALAKSFLGA
jgi:hypothetical protein